MKEKNKESSTTHKIRPSDHGFKSPYMEVKNANRKTWKKKFCLKCEKKFISKGPYNRICQKCNHKNDSVFSK